MAGYTDNFVTALGDLVTSLTASDLMDYRRMVFQQIYEPRDVRTTEQVVTGVRNGAVLPIFKRKLNPDAFPFVDPATGCNPTTCDMSNEYSAHTWETGLIECRLPICLRKFSDDFHKFWNTCRGSVDMDTAMLDWISRTFIDNLRLGSFRVAYFSDKSETSAIYNKINGIFAQMQTQSGNIIAVTENAGVSYTAQALTGEKAYQYLEQMYIKASGEAWFDPSTMEFKVTKSFASALVSYLNKAGRNAPGTCECIDPNTATAMQTFMLEGLRVFGIPVRVKYEWDEIINGSSVLNNGTVWTKPHRAILSPVENVLIGTCDEDLINSFDMWYSRDDKTVYIEGSSWLGGGVPLLTDFVLAI